MPGKKGIPGSSGLVGHTLHLDTTPWTGRRFAVAPGRENEQTLPRVVGQAPNHRQEHFTADGCHATGPGHLLASPENPSLIVNNTFSTFSRALTPGNA